MRPYSNIFFGVSTRMGHGLPSPFQCEPMAKAKPFCLYSRIGKQMKEQRIQFRTRSCVSKVKVRTLKRVLARPP